MTEELRSGYTTGSCSAAATKAALHLLIHLEKLETVSLKSLNGV
ncbi:MAG: cobalt-precorrin-5B (C(1))-methyltransferase, partial [Fusobacteriaceae bacterium]